MKLSKTFLACAMFSVLAVCCEYAISRPASQALFLTYFSAKAYPWVWLITIPINFAVIALYSRYLPKIGPFRMLACLAGLTVCINAVAAFGPPAMTFLQFIWKDIYILLMLKQIWSMIHVNVAKEKAKYLYGCIYGLGTIGAVAGSLVPACFASLLGTERLLLFTGPIYLMLLFSYKSALKRSEGGGEVDLDIKTSTAESFNLIRRTPVLLGILLLVIFMQISVGLTEYRFNVYLEESILDKDLRTAYCGEISSFINGLSFIFQLIGGLFMVRFFGLKGSHLLIPLLLGSSSLFLAPPFAYVFLKAVDFSLFGVVREMLYPALPNEAKYRAKAIIDVFAYRTSKGFVSLALLFLQPVLSSMLLLHVTGILSLFIFAAWIWTVSRFFRKAHLI